MGKSEIDDGKEVEVAFLRLDWLTKEENVDNGTLSIFVLHMHIPTILPLFPEIVTRELERLLLSVTSKEKLRSWLSPPYHFINHNTACDTQYGGTGMWFIQGNTFQDWKRNGSLLWVRGIRTFRLFYWYPRIS